MNPKFEHIVTSLSHAEAPETEQKLISKYGDMGWELVAVVVKQLRGEHYTFYYFRRLKVSKGK